MERENILSLSSFLHAVKLAYCFVKSVVVRIVALQ